MSVALCVMTDVDRADPDGWLARTEFELSPIAVEPLERVVDTSSAVLLRASFKPGRTVVRAAITELQGQVLHSHRRCKT